MSTTAEVFLCLGMVVGVFCLGAIGTTLDGIKDKIITLTTKTQKQTETLNAIALHLMELGAKVGKINAVIEKQDNYLTAEDVFDGVLIKGNGDIETGVRKKKKESKFGEGINKT